MGIVSTVPGIYPGLKADGDVVATPRNAAGEVITTGAPITYLWTIRALNAETTLPTLTNIDKATVTVGGMAAVSFGSYELTVTVTQGSIVKIAAVTVSTTP